MRNQQNSSSSSQHAASSMCDEIVTLWRLAALNPALTPIQHDDLASQLKDWHIKTIDKVRKGRSANMSAANANIKKSDIEIFSGYKASIEACQLDWKDYHIPGLTCRENDSHLRWKFSFGKITDGDGRRNGRGKPHNIAQASTTGVQHKIGGGVMGPMLPSQRQLQRHMYQYSRQNTADFEQCSTHTDGACSSSSEGFCESDRLDSLPNPQDSDSDFNEVGDLQHKHDKHRLPKNSSNHVDGFNNNTASSSKWESKVGNFKVDTFSNSNSTQAEAASASTSQGPDQEGGASAVPSASASNSSVAAATAAASAAQPEAAKHNDNPNDEYQVYFFDPKVKLVEPSNDKKKKSDEPNYFAGIKKLENKQDVSIS